ncbi:uncharacterized protein Mb2257 [Arthrobacter sp. Hiyo8]|nr:uncharacterized protein Mb2257 [Arthrobacter sp. Hiyo8]
MRASDVERRATKAEVIGEALLRLASLGIDISNPAMVGDRSYDVAGAAEHGISTFFALWGYGEMRRRCTLLPLPSHPQFCCR